MKAMLRIMAVLGMISGLASLGRAGTPQDVNYSGQASFSGTTILASSASTVGTATLTLNVSTPTAINSGGGVNQGRNCFTRFLIQVGTTTVVTIADGNTTKWTIYGQGLGTTGTNTLSLPEDHLGPWCTTAGNQTLFTLTPGVGALSANPESINVEGYTTYGGTLNSGPMY